VTVDTISRIIGIGLNAVQEKIESLGYRKVCARWVPRLFTKDHNGQRKAISSELLQKYRQEGEEILFRIVTSDESWFHHFEPETKRQNMEWHHLRSPSTNKAKTVPLAAKVMGTVFLETECLILAELLERGKPSLLLVMSRHCTSSVVHCAVKFRKETPSSCMTTLAPMPLASHRKQMQSCGGKFFHTPPTALIRHPRTTIFLAL